MLVQRALIAQPHLILWSVLAIVLSTTGFPTTNVMHNEVLNEKQVPRNVQICRLPVLPMEVQVTYISAHFRRPTILRIVSNDYRLLCKDQQIADIHKKYKLSTYLHILEDVHYPYFKRSTIENNESVCISRCIEIQIIFNINMCEQYQYYRINNI